MFSFNNVHVLIYWCRLKVEKRRAYLTFIPCSDNKIKKECFLFFCRSEIGYIQQDLHKPLLTTYHIKRKQYVWLNKSVIGN